ncbi:chorismate-binding protein [Oxyplasma meridianum]|uniref:Chorismate-binding protein n=1 Tax=Oxyplasma meridianum TaxID=3073602 RepID=A0AAX4NEB6_9ARCH
MPLCDLIPSLLEGHDNFAYFCKFDDVNKTEGKETLFSSNGKPEMMNSQEEINRFFQTLKGLDDGIDIPVAITFDFVSENFPGVKFLRSEWPLIMSFIPEKIEKGTYKRIAKKERKIVARENLEDRKLTEIIAQLRERIRNGEFLQVVISRDFQLPAFDPIRCLREFLEFDRSVYVYYYRFGRFQIIGSSPENLVTMKDGRITVDPIAGTVRRGVTIQEDELLGKTLINDSKELCEHRMLVDLARNDLARVSIPGTVKVEKNMEIGKFGNVQHLVSRVSSDSATDDLLEVIRSVFPAGTVSGAPKRRSLEIIGMFEDTPRGPYSGSIGIVGRNRMDLALLIRSVYCSGNEYYTRSGAGIVCSSVPEKEVQEIFTKSLNVMEVARIESFND